MGQLELNSDHQDDFTERITYFVDVIIPVPIPGTFTYRVPQKFESSISRGCRVIVQFGRRKVYTGIIDNIHRTPPAKYEAKSIMDLLEISPSIKGIQLDLFYWLAEYYMCTVGEVFNSALPSGLKLTSESFIQLNPQPVEDDQYYELSDKEQMILDALSNKDKLSYEEIPDIIGVKQVHPILKSLLQKERIILFEQLKDKYKPRKVKRIKLANEWLDEPEMLEQLFSTLEKRLKQQELLLKYLSLVPIEASIEDKKRGIEKSRLLNEGVSESSLKTMVKNGIFEQFEEIVSRLERIDKNDQQNNNLSPTQQRVKEQILQQYDSHNQILFHGITGSGKTEIYVDLIKDALDQGGQVLYLLPEIALTTQIVSRLREVFGNEMGIYHSKYSDNERVEVWQGILAGRFSLVIGVRSAVFLPFDHLSLIIVDEEHEPSYKQYDPAPRYNGRDVAVLLGELHKAKVLLGTATPSLESYNNALKGKYGLIELNERFGDAHLPGFELLDMKKARKQRMVKGDFSNRLIDLIKSTLENNKQVILFQNRRGYSPFLLCNDCNYVPKCENCSVSLTYHMYSNELRCHYCGHNEHLPAECPACSSTAIRTMGFGTEKLEEDMKLLFPEANLQRMDQDTTRSKYSYQNIIDDFARGDTDVLIGTQMVSKGLDFANVALVGVFDYDRMVHFPDFRSFERAFQLITQVSGRAGRSEEPGTVLIQTNDPVHGLLRKIISGDYIGFYQNEMVEREKFMYPPLHRLIKITFKHKELPVAELAASKFAKGIIGELGKKRVLGPQEPFISRIRNLYLREVYVKIEKKGINISKVKKMILLKRNELLKEKEFKGVRVIFDVDPV